MVPHDFLSLRSCSKNSPLGRNPTDTSILDEVVSLVQQCTLPSFRSRTILSAMVLSASKLGRACVRDRIRCKGRDVNVPEPPSRCLMRGTCKTRIRHVSSSTTALRHSSQGVEDGGLLSQQHNSNSRNVPEWMSSSRPGFPYLGQLSAARKS